MAEAGNQLLTQAPAWVWLGAVVLVALTCTALTKVSIVLSALRLALQAEALIPAFVVWSLSVMLTLVIMAPVLSPVWASLAQVQAEPSQWLRVVWTEGGPALLEFVKNHGSSAEQAFFADLQQLPLDHPLVSVPAFVVSELLAALRMTVVIFVPFLVIDVLLAQALTVMGLAAPLPWLGLPLKILLFLAIDGFELVILGLVESYR